MFAVYLLAQVPITPDGPLGGWGTLILQGAAFGLLAYVVCVLGPKLYEQGVEERRDHIAQFSATVEKIEHGFEERNARLTLALQAQTERIVGELERQTEKITQAFTACCPGGKPHTPTGGSK